jgi:hypothetical protein
LPAAGKLLAAWLSPLAASEVKAITLQTPDQNPKAICTIAAVAAALQMKFPNSASSRAQSSGGSDF